MKKPKISKIKKMKLKLSKISRIKKIILSGLILGVLTIVVVTRVVVIKINQNNEQDRQNKINAIKQKIIDKDILIAPNVSTQNQNEIQNAIKNQLQKENNLLTNNDLLKISTKLSSLSWGIKTKVTLIISIKFTSLSLSIYVEKINLLKNSNILDGTFGTIFQDDFGNLWAMGKNSKLQVLKTNISKDSYVNSGWTQNNSSTSDPLLKNSNVTNGYNGKIFQDSFKNLWTMSKDSKLQVLKVNISKNDYVTTGWSEDNSISIAGLLKGSNITNGVGGTIFQDEFKNLWAMGHESSLQVLKANQSGTGYDENIGWINVNDSGLLKGSNITSGATGTIFQDQFKNLWAMGKGTSLQVLRANDQKDGYDENLGWTNAKNSGLTNGSNITNGNYGTIFQDEFKNLWAMGNKTSLQVLSVNSQRDGYDESTGWNSYNVGLTKGSNITDGEGGVIFQDEFKNLWAMGYETSLQVLKANSQKDGYDEITGWNSFDSDLIKGSNIIDGDGGIIFQDEFKNLWATGFETSLQVLKANSSKDGYVSTGWTNANDSGLTKGSNIIDGATATIFQDEFKNLWAMSTPKIKVIEGFKKTIYAKLQVLKINEAKDGYVDSWQKVSD